MCIDFKVVDKMLTAHAWYHGLMPRKEVEDMLKARNEVDYKSKTDKTWQKILFIQTQGDYLVRKTTMARQIAYCLSVRHVNDVKHVPLGYNYITGKWTLKDVGELQMDNFLWKANRFLTTNQAYDRIE
uniref:SH2 domain-containing protein n=1 Tax=Angiostrongylus cantonensis TaxID=6313 RepID=A0A0K0CU39_ANGCA